MRLYYVSGSVLESGDVAVKEIPTSREFTILKRKSDQNKKEQKA